MWRKPTDCRGVLVSKKVDDLFLEIYDGIKIID
jgi:hypothetical protein